MRQLMLDCIRIHRLGLDTSEQFIYVEDIERAIMRIEDRDARARARTYLRDGLDRIDNARRRAYDQQASKDMAAAY